MTPRGSGPHTGWTVRGCWTVLALALLTWALVMWALVAL